jgi:arylsulfatase A-like enzyme
LFGKQNLYEFGGMHVPLVLAGPGIPHGRTDAFAYLYDLYPTVCELTGTAIPPEVESKNLVAVITGKTTKVRDYVFTAYRNCQRAVRDERWKLIRYPRINKNQLFDLEKDPHEINDLADKPEHTGKVREMMAILEKLQKEYDDSCPLTSANPEDPAWSPDKVKEPDKADSVKPKRKKKDAGK